MNGMNHPTSPSQFPFKDGWSFVENTKKKIVFRKFSVLVNV